MWDKDDKNNIGDFSLYRKVVVISDVTKDRRYN
jgi:hypothetical protein